MKEIQKQIKMNIYFSPSESWKTPLMINAVWEKAVTSEICSDKKYLNPFFDRRKRQECEYER